jgi:hypothetical protein
VLIGVGVVVAVCVGGAAFVAWNVGTFFGTASQALRPEYDVTLTAEVAEFTPSYEGGSGDYTVVYVTITNNSDNTTFQVSPDDLYVVDADGHRHASVIDVDANQLEPVSLSRGQTASGTIAVAATVEPAEVSFEPFLAPEPITVEVTGG